MTKQEIYAELRAIKAEMKAKGIKRTSFMNGGHSLESSRFNFRMYQLESELKKLKAEVAS